MVRTYKKKSTRGSWSLKDVETAVTAVKNGELSLREASQVYSIPKSTLERHKNKKVSKPGSLGRFECVLDQDFEKELVAYCVEMQQRLFGLSLAELRRIAYELAERNKLPHPFSRDKKLAGKDWAYAFMKRNPELSLRSPEPTSIARAVGFNRVQIGSFFNILKQEYDKYQFSPSVIWNVDETGLSAVQKPGRVLSHKGEKQVGKLTSLEKGKTFTVLCAVNAAGTFIPPMIIFPRVNMSDRLLVGAPPCTVGVALKSGWVDQDLFIKWFAHFVRYAKPSVEQPHLLLLDGHISHKSLALIDMAREHGVVIITFPPHTTHKLQPLDRVMYGPLKTFYNQECDKWLVNHPGKRITDYDIASLFSAAYMRSATMEKGTVGFSCTGLYPYNPDFFDDSDFAASQTTERSIPAREVTVHADETGDIILPAIEPGTEITVCIIGSDCNRNDADGAVSNEASIINYEVDSNVTNDAPAASGLSEQVEVEEFEDIVEIVASDLQMQQQESVIDVSDLSSTNTLEVGRNSPVTSSVRVHAVDISPIPTCCRTEQRKRKSQVAELITGSPYKKMLEDKLNMSSGKRQQAQKGKKKNPAKVSTDVGKKQSKRKNMKGKSTTDADTTPCGTCAVRYCDDTIPRNWIQCQRCEIWYHNDCQGLDERGPKTFECILCENAD